MPARPPFIIWPTLAEPAPAKQRPHLELSAFVRLRFITHRRIIPKLHLQPCNNSSPTPAAIINGTFIPIAELLEDCSNRSAPVNSARTCCAAFGLRLRSATQLPLWIASSTRHAPPAKSPHANHPTVTQIFNLPYRRFATCRPPNSDHTPFKLVIIARSAECILLAKLLDCGRSYAAPPCTLEQPRDTSLPSLSFSGIQFL